MTKTKKLGLLVFCLIVIFCIPLFFGGCSEEVLNPTDDYTLSNYNVYANVKNDGTITINENFTVNYLTSSLHGVSRYVPLNMTAYYDRNNSVVKKNYKVDIIDTNVLSGKCADKGINGDFYVFMLGDANHYVSAGTSQTFTIEYTLVMPDDRLGDMDVFYYNILPFDWDAPISNAYFEVNFDFDISSQELYDKTVVYAGEQGTTEILEDVNFEDSKISGNVSYISPFCGVTVYTELKEGVLGNKSNLYIIIAGVGLAVLLLGVVLSYLYYKKNKVIRQLVPTVEFKAPEGLTPAECGLVIDGKVDNRDLVSMIVYWASCGYLQIVDKDKKICLNKIKNLDETSKSFEKTIFNCIFKHGDNVDIEKISGLGEELIVAKAQLKKDLKHLNYEPKTKSARNNLTFYGCLIPALVMGLMLYLCVINLSILYAFIELIISFGVFRLYQYAVDKSYFHKKSLTITYKILSYLLIIIPCILFMIFAFELYVDKFLLVIIAHIVSIIIMYLSGSVLSRTEVSNKRLGQVIGLKTFILVTEKDKMEMLVKDNPTSFYSILPYAYVLNVSDVYCEKFKDIDLDVPNWYVNDTLTTNNLNALLMINLLNNSMNRTYGVLLDARNNVILKNLQSVAQEIGRNSGSGSGRTGGGFGGGGFGGGGGRGW